MSRSLYWGVRLWLPLAVVLAAMASVTGASADADRTAQDTGVALHEDERSAAEPQLQHLARLVVTTADAPALLPAIVSAVQAVGGQASSSSARRLSADVPRHRYRDFVRVLGKVAALRSEKLTTRDDTLRVSRARARRRAAVATLERLRELDHIAKSVQDGLALEREVARATEDLAGADAELRRFASQATLTRVEIEIVAPEVEHIEPARLPVGWLDELGLEDLYDPTGVTHVRTLELRGLEDFSAQLRGAWVPHADNLDGARAIFTGALSARILGEANPVGVFGGFDLVLGGSKGFVYGVQTLLGAGVPLGRRLAIGLAAGPGIDGITGVVPFGVGLPAELYASVDATDFMAVSLWAQDGWVLASDRRKDGSEHAPFGDELSLGLTLAVGERESFGTYTQRRKSLLFGFAYRETMATEIYELRFGWAFQGADYSGH